MILHLNKHLDTNLMFCSKEFSPYLYSDGDFWRLHLDYGSAGSERELGVYSHSRESSEITENEESLVIR